jgi:hypothetical protein
MLWLPGTFTNSEYHGLGLFSLTFECGSRAILTSEYVTWYGEGLRGQTTAPYQCGLAVLTNWDLSS